MEVFVVHVAEEQAKSQNHSLFHLETTTPLHYLVNIRARAVRNDWQRSTAHHLQHNNNHNNNIFN